MKILLYGNSILIESLASKFHHIQGWNVKRITGGTVSDVIGVDFVITDLCDVAVSPDLPMLCALLGVMLVGVDAITSTVTILTGRSHLTQDMEHVLGVLKDVV